MKLRIAVADDSESDMKRLISAIENAAEGVCGIECVCFANGDSLLAADVSCDAFFLDICMDGTDGIATAEKLRSSNSNIPIVFVTSSEEYVWDSFAVHPFDYLLKSYDGERIRRLFSDLVKKAGGREPELKIMVSRQGFSVPFSKISYVTAHNHTVNIAVENTVYRSAATFSGIKDELCADPRFLLCNRGVIVNMDRVLRFDSDAIEMSDGAVFPVRQRDRTKLFGEFTQYQFRTMRNEV